MNLREIEYVVAVAELGSFSRAAKQCCVTQPTLSAQIKKLEAYLGVAIFERTNRRVMPTESGREIIQSARKILQEVAKLKEIAQAAHNPLAGKFRLGAFPTLANYIFPDLVAALTQRMPNLSLYLVEEKTDLLLTALNQGAIDAAFLALPVHDNYLFTQKLFDDPFYLAVSDKDKFAARKSVSAAELQDMQLLLLQEGHCLRDQALEVCELMGINEAPDVRATSLETLRQMVRANTGATLIPEVAIKRNDQGLRYIPFASNAPVRSIGLVWRKTSQKTQVCEQIIQAVEDWRQTRREQSPR